MEITEKTHIAHRNPLRYRSYYYDSETGFYHLQTRYYVPEFCRFLNAGAMVKTPGLSVISANMFASCENNPIIRSDSTGQSFGLSLLVAGVVGAFVGAASQLVSDLITSAMSGSWQFSAWQTYAGAAVGGAVGGVVSMFTSAASASAIGASVSTIVGQSLENITGGKKRSATRIAINAVGEGALGWIGSKCLPVSKPGITTGRNSMASVYKSGLTKLRNKTATIMEVKFYVKLVFCCSCFSSYLYFDCIFFVRRHTNRIKIKKGLPRISLSNFRKRSQRLDWQLYLQ